jgi:DNA-binding CsgD family transcriptional regulator
MDSMLCPVLIGRGAELEVLIGALGAAAAGHGSAVFVTGDAGVGKSRLAKDLAAEAVRQGFLVLTGRGAESAVPVPYRPISEALLGAARAGLGPDAPGVTDYRAVLGALVPEWSPPGGGAAEVSPVVVGEAILRTLAQAEGPGGLLILEDLHWADPETLAIVEYLADNAAAARVLCVITLRDTGASPCLDLVSSAAARRVATRIELSRLGQDAVRQMAAACLGVDEPPAGVSRLLADCDGLPFAVEEILAAAVSSGELVRDESGWRVDGKISTGVPDSIAGSVRSRIAALGPEVGRVIVCAAVLGRQFDWTLLPPVAGVPQRDVLEALRSAHDMQLIEPSFAEPGLFRFRHSLTRDAILSDLLPPDLAARATAAAGVIERAHPGLPGGWCELVAELLVTAGRPVEAARMLLTVGRRALDQGAVDSARVALEDAGRLLSESPLTDPMLGLEVDEAMTEALSLAGDYERLASLTDNLLVRLAAAGAQPRRQALVRLRVAATRPEDHPDAASGHLSAAAAIAAALSDGELASRIDAVEARKALAEGEMDRAEALARRALSAAEDAGLTGWAAEVALESLEIIGRRERPRDLRAARSAFERAYQLATDGGERGVWRIKALHELATIDMLEDGSAEGLSQVAELAHQAGAISTAVLAELQLANLWSIGTDLDRALEAARQCQRSAAQIGAAKLAAMAISLQANVAAIRADRREAEAGARRAEDTLPDEPEILVATWGQTRVLAALFRDDLAQAQHATAIAAGYAKEAVAAPRRSQGFYSPLQAPLVAPRRGLALHALLQAMPEGGGRSPIDLARQLGVATSWNGGCLAYAEAVLEGRAGHAERADALAAEGARHFAPFAPWWNHLVRRMVAPLALQDGWGEPVAWMRDAAVEFEATGHDRLAAACRNILRGAGQRVPRSGRGRADVPPQMRKLGITSREMDVYLLVALGLSNAEIAAKLYISPKTVETHVASLVAKTGQGGRRELAAYAARFTSS